MKKYLKWMFLVFMGLIACRVLEKVVHPDALKYVLGFSLFSLLLLLLAYAVCLENERQQ